MTPADDQPRPTTGKSLGLPAGLTEADMIDLVDGKLAADREQAVLSALKAEPKLALLVRQMRGDEAGLAMLRDVRVPTDLGDRIESALQTQALRDLAAQEAQAPAEAVMASVVTVREASEGGAWRILLESAWPRRLATAASIAIVAGVGYLGYNEYQRSLQRPGLGITTTGGAAPIVPEPVNPTSIEIAADPAKEPTTPDGPTPDTAVAAAEAMTPERAIELARQGRLVISVRLPSAGSDAMKRVESIARAAGREGGWRPMPMNQLPPAYAGLMTPSIEVPQSPLPNGPGQPTLTSDGQAGPGPSATPQLSTPRRPVVVAIYAVELAPRGAMLTGLLDALSPGRPEGAVFRVVDAPMLPAAPVSPEDVLWWQNPPASWGLKVRVPVVVEGLE